jgi:hypothetical protein
MQLIHKPIWVSVGDLGQLIESAPCGFFFMSYTYRYPVQIKTVLIVKQPFSLQPDG